MHVLDIQDKIEWTRGPRAFYRSTDNQQQTVRSEKKDMQPEWQYSNKCMCRQCRRQYISMLLWIFGLKEDFVKGEALPLPFFCPTLDSPLGISGRNRYQNGSIPSKAFCLWSSLTPSCHALDPTQGGSDKSLNTCAGNKNFIPTKFHKHPLSSSVVKADYVCSLIYTCISASPPFPSPK